MRELSESYHESVMGSGSVIIGSSSGKASGDCGGSNASCKLQVVVAVAVAMQVVLLCVTT